MKTINDKTIEKSIKYRINAHPPGWCMSPSHFADLGSDGAIRISLYRLAKKGIIRRVSKGIYECPRKHEHLGILSPSIDKIAQAISERDDIQIQPSGAYAANLLGLSEQVPAKVVFVTNGPSKKIKIDKMEIVFRHTTNKNVHNAGTTLGLIIQAIKHVGKTNLTKPVLFKLKKHIAALDEKSLKNVTYAPAWIRHVILDLRRDLNG